MRQPYIFSFRCGAEIFHTLSARVLHFSETRHTSSARHYALEEVAQENSTPMVDDGKQQISIYMPTFISAANSFQD